jgi:hypothetical protein
MTTIYGTVTNGKIELPAPADWPDGTPVRVEPVAETAMGMREEDWRTDPEAIEAWCAAIDALEPLILTPDDEARIRAAREDQLRIDSAAAAALEAAARGVGVTK